MSGPLWIEQGWEIFADATELQLPAFVSSFWEDFKKQNGSENISESSSAAHIFLTSEIRPGVCGPIIFRGQLLSQVEISLSKILGTF